MYNCIQWVYDIILTVEVVAILIYRKIGEFRSFLLVTFLAYHILFPAVYHTLF